MKNKLLITLITTLSLILINTSNISLSNELNKDSYIKPDINIKTRAYGVGGPNLADTGSGTAYKVRVNKRFTSHLFYYNYQRLIHSQWINGKLRSGTLYPIHYQLIAGTNLFDITYEGYLF